jgi:hypothetical protein
MDMPKFESQEDPGYRYVSNELWRWVRAIDSTPESQQQLSRIEPGYLQPAVEQSSTFGARDDQGSLPGNDSIGQSEPSKPQAVPSSEATGRRQHEEGTKGRRVYQGGNKITGSTTVSGGGKVVQGNNISADKDVNLSF